MKAFSITHALKFGIHSVIHHFGLVLALFFTVIGSFIGFALIAVLIFLGPNLVTIMQSGMQSITMHIGSFHFFDSVWMVIALALLAIITIFFMVWIKLGLVRIALNIYDTSTARVSDLFSESGVVFSGLIMYILYRVLVAVGLLFFVVPGLFFLTISWFAPYALVDRKLGPVQAISFSYELTRNNKLYIFLYILVICIITGLASLFYGVGLLLVEPILLMANVYVYKKLLYMHQIQPVR